jgi:hypothetical protein
MQTKENINTFSLYAHRASVLRVTQSQPLVFAFFDEAMGTDKMLARRLCGTPSNVIETHERKGYFKGR